jgi:hypothetical protein
MAHKPNDLSRQLVKNMAKCLPKKHIAMYMGLNIKTLNKHYEEELKETINIKMKLVQTAIDIALEDRNVTMIIFLLKTFVGLTEDQAEQAAEHAMAEPMEIKFDVLPAKNEVKVKKGK